LTAACRSTPRRIGSPPTPRPSTGGADRRVPAPAAQKRGQMTAQVARIVLGAVHEARLAAAHEVETEHVQPRRVDDAAVVTQPAFVIEDGKIEPRIVRAKTRSPDHRRNALAR